MSPDGSKFCGTCGKILMISYGRTDSACPYCDGEFPRRPKAKTKCRSCGDYVYVRTRPPDEERVLLTEADARFVEIQWATLNNRLDAYLREKADEDEAKAVLRKRLGKEPSTREVQIEVLKKLNPQRREAQRKQYKEMGVSTEWEWCTPMQQRSCVVCLAMDGQVFPVSVSFDSVMNCENEYCRCSMLPVIVGTDLEPRTNGSDWFKSLPAAVQRNMLGDDRYREYSDGKSLQEIILKKSE